MATEEDNHGSRLDDLYSQDTKLRSSGGAPVGPVLRQVASTELESLPPQAITLAVGVLSIGAVLALLLFIALCFWKPDAANVIVPLVVTPIVTVLVQHYLKKKVEGESE